MCECNTGFRCFGIQPFVHSVMDMVFWFPSMFEFGHETPTHITPTPRTSIQKELNLNAHKLFHWTYLHIFHAVLCWVNADWCGQIIQNTIRHRIKFYLHISGVSWTPNCAAEYHIMHIKLRFRPCLSFFCGLPGLARVFFCQDLPRLNFFNRARLVIFLNKICRPVPN